MKYKEFGMMMKGKSVFFVILIMMAAMGTVMFAQEAEIHEHEEVTVQEAEHSLEAEAESATPTSVWKYFAAALAVGISCIAGGVAVGQIGSAAMGAMSENPELAGKALPYAGLAEGICLWGFLVALFILLV